jgi:CheY-like chemotaxis protein
MRRAQPLLTQPMNAGTLPRRDAPPVTILNVDDNESMLFARSTILRTEGFHVLEAQTGRAALQILESHVPRLVLLDVHLPDMSGLDVCRQIKADKRLSGVKVVQTSATFSSPHDQLHGLQSGGADMYSRSRWRGAHCCRSSADCWTSLRQTAEARRTNSTAGAR